MPRRDLSRAEDFALNREELARAERWKLALALCVAPPEGGSPPFACIHEAERVVDRMRFVRWLRGEERMQS